MITVRCKKHPKYQGLRHPRTKEYCHGCMTIRSIKESLKDTRFCEEVPIKKDDDAAERSV